jgi:hypothetical protein
MEIYLEEIYGEFPIYVVEFVLVIFRRLNAVRQLLGIAEVIRTL